MVRRLLIASMKFHRNTHKPLLGPLASRCSLRYMSCSRPRYNLSAKLDRRGKDLIVQGNGEDYFYHSTWLRHNCQCPSCLAPSGQKTIDLSEITPSITLESVALLGLWCYVSTKLHSFLIDGRLNLSWSSGHHGYIEIDYFLRTRGTFLRQNADLSSPKTAVSVCRNDLS